MSQSNPIDVFQFVCAESLYLFYFLCYFYVVVVVVVVFAIRTPIIFLTPWTPWANQNEQCVFWVLQSCRAIQRIDHFDSAMRWRGVLTNNRWHRSLHIREKHREAEGRWTQVSWIHMVVFLGKCLRQKKLHSPLKKRGSCCSQCANRAPQFSRAI